MKTRFDADNDGASGTRLTRRILVSVTFGLTALALTGCNILPQAQIDPTRFYVLSAPAVASVVDPLAKAPAIRLRPVELATYIKAKPLIVRRGGNEIEFRDYARWGEPLERGIGRVLREVLLARGAASAVQVNGLRTFTADYDYELAVRVLTCEGNADGSVQFRARWELDTTGKVPTVAARGDFQATDLKWDTKSEAELANRLSEAVAGLAGEIAVGLAKAKG